ncbi:MAG: TIGR02530 family flagellar biosynthesis protein [Candidatus Kapaibacterium sp.]
MVPGIEGVSLPFIPAGGADALRRQSGFPVGPAPKTSFDKVFADELDRLKFSGHAQSRMVSRDISIDEAEMQKLDTAVDAAAGKGARETLVLMPDKAFIVDVGSKTVITAMSREAADMKVITNIDSAVLLQ